MKTIRSLVTLLAVLFLVSFADGMFSWGFSTGFYAVVGVVELISIGWLLIAVYKKD